MDANWQLSFTVSGQPVPQPRARISTRGGFGRAYVESKHPIHAYRQAIEIEAVEAARLSGHKPSPDPVVLEVVCVFGRPPSHMTKSGNVRPTAPRFPPRCDWDNLGKGVSDSITESEVVWCDDDQVVDGRVVKRYSMHPEADPPRTIITVRAADEWFS
jgi:Holliday junction resolvase RusA-like endonuclease